MKAIHNKVNIVPVIAKADTLTLKERERLKKRVSKSWLPMPPLHDFVPAVQEAGGRKISAELPEAGLQNSYSVFVDFFFCSFFTFHPHRIRFV